VARPMPDEQPVMSTAAEGELCEDMVAEP